MTNEQQYEFDLRGFLICRNMLSADEVQHCTSVIAHKRGSAKSGKFSFFEMDRFFMQLMARPKTIRILKHILGEWLRFDHAFGIEMTKTESVAENLHAGPLQNQRAFWYQWAGQSMHNGLIKVIYALNDVEPGDGGFICVPGSHKGNVYYRPPHDSPLVINPTMKAGDMLIFTEALVHGSRQWVADRTRRVLIYSYGPGCLAWKHPDTVRKYRDLAQTDLEHDLLRPPYVGDYDEHEAERTGEWPDGRRTPIMVS